MNSKLFKQTSITSNNHIIIGNETDINNGIYITTDYNVGLKIFNSTSKKKSELNNQQQKPVIICTLAEMNNVINLYKDFVKTVIIAANNDISDSGNIGLYNAYKLLSNNKVKIIYPFINLTSSCTFDDTLEFRKVKIDKTKLSKLVVSFQYAPTNELPFIVDNIIKELSRLSPSKLSLKDSCKFILDLLKTRNYVHDKDTNYELQILDMFKQNKLSSTLNLIGVHVLKMKSLNNKQIGEQLKLLGNKDISIILNWDMGTGKTQTVLDLIENIFPNDQHMCISPRKTLVTDICSQSNKITNYQKEISNYKNSATCINSLPKYDSNKFDFIHTDEVVTVFKHGLVGSVSNRTEVLSSYETNCRNASYLTFADADLDNFTLDRIKQLSVGKTIYLLTKDSKIRNKTVTICKHKKSLYSLLVNLYKQNKNSAIAVTTENEGLDLIDVLLLQGAKENEIRFIHDKSTDITQEAFFENINDYSKQYRFLIYTTKMGTGVSITNNHFHNNFLISNGNLSTNDCTQMLGRNRCTDNYYVYVANNHIDRFTEHEANSEGSGQNFQWYMEKQTDGSFIPSEVGKLRLQLMNSINEDLNDSSNNIIRSLAIKGFNIIYDETEQLEVTIDKETRNKNKVTNILNAKTITNEDEEYILANNKTAYHIFELEKKKVANMCNKVKVDKTDIEHYIKGYSSKINLFNIVHSDIKDNLEWDKDNQKTQNESYSKTYIQSIANKTILDFKDKIIDKETAFKIIDILKSESKQLGNNGFGNYNKKIDRPIQIYSNFITQFGYELVEVENFGNGNRLYKIQPNNYVHECFNRK